MSVITFVCAGQMNSAITFPAFENGHEVRLVGSPLDRDIIDGLRKDNFHITLKRTLHDGREPCMTESNTIRSRSCRRHWKVQT